MIGKYIVDLKTTTPDGLSLQKELQESIEQKLFPRMEQLFDRIAIQDISITIDKIDVEVELTKGNDWLDKLLDKILEKMETNILTGINYARREVDETRQEGIRRMPESGLLKSKALKTIESFTFFLKHGYLPWWCAGEEFSLKEQPIMEMLQSFETSTNEIESLKQELRVTLSNERAVERLLQQFSENLFHSLLNCLFPVEGLSIIETIEEYELFEQVKKLPELYSRQRMDEFKKDLLLTALKRHSDMNWKKFVGEHVTKESHREYTETPRVEVDGIQDEATPFEERQSISEKLPKKKNEKDRAQLIRELFSVQDVNPDEGIFISNAGLVIVAPFLPRLFENLGWLRDGQLPSPTRAIYLLHYLVSGNTKGMEYEFALNKILCGVEVNEPLSRVEELRSNELEEADKVLMAILEHWKVLKNTSMEGLRESFLLRNGKLSRTESNWLLQVEQKPYDMLLQTLPWSISLIQLPFMKTSLQVDWN